MRKDIPGRRSRHRHRILENSNQFGLRIWIYKRNSGDEFENFG